MKESVDIIEFPGRWDIHYNYSAGVTASKFLLELKKNKRFLATTCSKCSRVYLPPRSFCERCFIKITNWASLGGEGTVETFTLIGEKFEGFPDPPYVVAYVKIDGADTAMANFIKGIDLSNQKKALEKLKIGMRVKAVFKDRREGRMTDFVFKPV